MKLYTFAGLFIFTFSVFAQTPCSRNRNHCYQSAPWSANGLLHAMSSPIDHANENAAVYFARGTGNSCNAAYSNGTQVMMDNFDYLICGGAIKCGNNGVPFLTYQNCSRVGNTYVAWLTCNNLYHSDPPSRPSPDSSGLGIVLLRSLQEGEVRARASRGR